MKVKILTNRLNSYELNEEVNTHSKATNYRALMNLVSQKEAKIIGVEPIVKPVAKPVIKKVIKKGK